MTRVPAINAAVLLLSAGLAVSSLSARAVDTEGDAAAAERDPDFAAGRKQIEVYRQRG